jgi:hypothetical protein
MRTTSSTSESMAGPRFFSTRPPKPCAGMSRDRVTETIPAAVAIVLCGLMVRAFGHKRA